MENVNLALLNSLYQNTAMGINAINQIIPKIDDTQLKGELQAQLNNYHGHAENLRQQIYALDSEPADLGVLQKATSNAGIAFSTLTNSSTTHIAEMMIQGTNMGVIDINKLLNQCQPIDENLKTEARNILSQEQQYIDKLKMFL